LGGMGGGGGGGWGGGRRVSKSPLVVLQAALPVVYVYERVLYQPLFPKQVLMIALRIK